jgi:hypothetical protein
MRNENRIESRALVEAGLAVMEKAGKPITRLPSRGRAMIYALPDGKTVRVRTCNDHVLIVPSDGPEPEAKLGIEGTDWLLVVMPERERTQGKIIAYLIPTAEAVAEARRTHRDWLDSNPNTKGDNRTWTLGFQADGKNENNYSVVWAKHRLDSAVAVFDTAKTQAAAEPSNIKVEVENARRRIAKVAGVPVEAVRIMINFAG